jgi:hypothetical protein
MAKNTGTFVSTPINATDPKQFVVDKINLITQNGQAILLNPIMTELNIFVDLFSPVMTGNMLLMDARGFLEFWDVSGYNFIQISFSNTGTAEDNVTKTFRIYKTSKRVMINSSTQSYSLEFCSEEMVLSEQNRIAKSFKNTTISDIVRQILDTNLQISSSRMGTIEDTQGQYTFVIPNLKVFESINWLSTFALPISSSGNSADMIFYEDFNGFNFRSLQTMFKQTPYGNGQFTYQYSPQNTETFADPNRYNFNKRSIMNYHFISTFDTLKATNYGIFANKLITLDPLLRQANVVQFNYDDYYDSSKSLGKNKITANYTNRLGQKVSDTSDAVLKMTVSNKNDTTFPFITSDSSRLASVNPNYNFETIVPYRTAQIALTDYIKIEITIPGDSSLRVGTVITLDIPTLNPDNKTKVIDKYYSGNYLITAIRHQLDPRGIYMCLVEAIKDAVESPHVSVTNNSAASL